MKKLFNNSDIMNIANTLQAVGSRKGNINERWNLALLSEPFLRKVDIIILSQNQLINEYGTEKKDGSKTLEPNEEHLLKLMNCETEVEFVPIALDMLQETAINELIALKEVIVDGEHN